VYTHQDIYKFDKKIKEFFDKGLINNSKRPHSSTAFMIRNHVGEKRGKVRMVITKSLMIIPSLMVIIFLTKLFRSIEFKEHLGSQNGL